MWSKDRAVGNAYPRCPRPGPAPFRRFVHMSTAWAMVCVGWCSCLGVVLLSQCTVPSAWLSPAKRSAALRVKRARP
jgi:hypothetical protein